MRLTNIGQKCFSEIVGDCYNISHTMSWGSKVFLSANIAEVYTPSRLGPPFFPAYISNAHSSINVFIEGSDAGQKVVGDLAQDMRSHNHGWLEKIRRTCPDC